MNRDFASSTSSAVAKPSPDNLKVAWKAASARAEASQHLATGQRRKEAGQRDEALAEFAKAKCLSESALKCIAGSPKTMVGSKAETTWRLAEVCVWASLWSAEVEAQSFAKRPILENLSCAVEILQYCEARLQWMLVAVADFCLQHGSAVGRAGHAELEADMLSVADSAYQHYADKVTDQQLMAHQRSILLRQRALAYRTAGKYQAAMRSAEEAVRVSGAAKDTLSKVLSSRVLVFVACHQQTSDHDVDQACHADADEDDDDATSARAVSSAALEAMQSMELPIDKSLEICRWLWHSKWRHPITFRCLDELRTRRAAAQSNSMTDVVEVLKLHLKLVDVKHHQSFEPGTEGAKTLWGAIKAAKSLETNHLQTIGEAAADATMVAALAALGARKPDEALCWEEAAVEIALTEDAKREAKSWLACCHMAAGHRSTALDMITKAPPDPARSSADFSAAVVKLLSLVEDGQWKAAREAWELIRLHTAEWSKARLCLELAFSSFISSQQSSKCANAASEVLLCLMPLALHRQARQTAHMQDTNILSVHLQCKLAVHLRAPTEVWDGLMQTARSMTPPVAESSKKELREFVRASVAHAHALHVAGAHKEAAEVMQRLRSMIEMPCVAAHHTVPLGQDEDDGKQPDVMPLAKRRRCEPVEGQAGDAAIEERLQGSVPVAAARNDVFISSCQEEEANECLAVCRFLRAPEAQSAHDIACAIKLLASSLEDLQGPLPAWCPSHPELGVNGAQIEDIVKAWCEDAAWPKLSMRCRDILFREAVSQGRTAESQKNVLLDVMKLHIAAVSEEADAKGALYTAEQEQEQSMWLAGMAWRLLARLPSLRQQPEDLVERVQQLLAIHRPRIDSRTAACVWAVLRNMELVKPGIQAANRLQATPP